MNVRMVGPIVTASFEQVPESIHSMSGEMFHTLGVRVECEFPLGSHVQMLAALDRAVADVRRQIADAAEGAES